jgi:hypothetical protein
MPARQESAGSTRSIGLPRSSLPVPQSRVQQDFHAQQASPALAPQTHHQPPATDYFLSNLQVLVQAQEQSFRASQALLEEYKRMQAV